MLVTTPAQQRKCRRIVTSAGLVHAFPEILTTRMLDFWAQQTPPILPFTQPGGPCGKRFYDLDVAEAILAGDIPTPVPTATQTHPKPPQPRIKQRGKSGKGLAAFRPKKRGPKPSTSGEG